MKACKTAMFLMLFISSLELSAQNSDASGRQALNAANHLLTAYKLHDWNQYVDLSYAGLVAYYGGRKSFIDFLERSALANAKRDEDVADETSILQMIHESGGLQCVIKKIAKEKIDGKQATIISYLIGKSDDEGRSWKYFDVSFASPQDLVFVMPDISEKLQVPERRIIFHASEMALN